MNLKLGKLFSKANVIIYLVILISIFLHFLKIPNNFVFDLDTEYQTLLAKTIVKDFHIIWIGVSASNTGYYLGPGLVYLTAFLFKLSNGDPIILGYFASFVGILTTISVYLVTNDLFKRKTSLLTNPFSYCNNKNCRY